MTKSFNVVTIKWGTMYNAEDVNKLYSAILRNTSYQINFYCFTDNAVGLSDGIIALPIPKLNVQPQFIFGNHRKASGLCDDNLAELNGQRVFFFDLDSLIVGNLDEFFDYPVGNRFYAINDWAHRHGKKANQVGQASCYSWVVGTLGYIKEYFEKHPQEVIEKFGKIWFWPDNWFKSFRFHCIPHPLLRFFITPKLPPVKGLKMIAFHGEPGIREALQGVWCLNPQSAKYPHGFKKLYKHVRPTSWIADYWK